VRNELQCWIASAHPKKRTATAAQTSGTEDRAWIIHRVSPMLEALCRDARACCVRASRPRDPTMVFSARTAGSTLKFVVSAKHDSSATITVIAPVESVGTAERAGPPSASDALRRTVSMAGAPPRVARRARARLSTGHIFVRDDGPQSALARHGSPLSAEIILCVHSTIFSGVWASPLDTK